MTRRDEHRNKAIQDCLKQVIKDNPTITIGEGKEKARKLLIEKYPHLNDMPGHDKVTTKEDVEVRRNHFVFVDGNYPASMGDCTVIGISGDCPGDCRTCIAADSFVNQFINIGALCPKCNHKIHYCDYRYMNGGDKRFPLCPKCKHTVTEEEIFAEQEATP